MKPPQIDKRAIIDHVLPEYQKISEAPGSVFDLPEFHAAVENARVHDISKRDMSATIDGIEARARKHEQGKKYKAVDADGNIYLIANPWVWKRDEETRTAFRPEPEFVMTYQQALVAAAERSPAPLKALPAPTSRVLI